MPIPPHGGIQGVFNENGVQSLSPEYMMDFKAPVVRCAGPAARETMRGRRLDVEPYSASAKVAHYCLT